MSKSNLLNVLPWKEKKEKKKTNMSSNEVRDKEKPLGCVGSLNIYKLINITNKKLNQKNIKYDKIYEKNYEEMTGCFYYDEDSNILAVGFVSGKIFIYKVPPEENYTHFDFMIALHYHKGKITGISIDNKLGYIYTCGEDKKLFVGDYSEIYSPNFIPLQLNEKNPIIKEYIKLELDKINHRLFCATSDRRIEIYLTNENPPVLVCNIETSCQGRLNDFIINYTKSFLFCVDSKGNISIVDFNKPGKEKLGKEISTFNYYGKKINFTSIIYYEQRNELITGDTEGRLIVWSLKKGRPILVHKIHKRPITKMLFFVDKEMDCNLLMVCYDDCNMNLVKIPDKWLEKEELEKFEENEIKASSDLNAMIYLQKNMEKDENYNSDEDSLNGWDYFANYTHDEEEMKRDML
jgi:WD40 repeat protein